MINLKIEKKLLEVIDINTFLNKVIDKLIKIIEKLSLQLSLYNNIQQLCNEMLDPKWKNILDPKWIKICNDVVNKQECYDIDQETKTINKRIKINYSRFK